MKLFEKLSFSIIGLMICFNSFGQFNWWNEANDWETGMPSWKTFMEISPGYLGVNALPVPHQIEGVIPKENEIEIAADFHAHAQETVENIYVRYLHSFANGKIAVEFYGVPIEHYTSTTELRDYRHSRIFEAEDVSIGDIYCSTHILLMEEKDVLPSAVFRMTFKTAMGELKGARWTDTPGYYYDLSSGKNFSLSDQINLRVYGMAGFYCWQTTDDVLLQNDAFLWGGGVRMIGKRWSLNVATQGYSGYKMNYDRPANNRYSFQYKFELFEWRIEYQKGWRDVLYDSFRTGIVYRF